MQSIVKTLVLSTSVLATFSSALQIVRRSEPDSSVWEKLGRSDESTQVSFSIALQGERAAELDDKMLSIAMERSAWLTQEELAQYVAPSAEAKQNLEHYLINNGVPASSWHYSSLGDVMHIEANVSRIETVRRSSGCTTHADCSQLFNTVVEDYRHAETGQIFAKTTQAHLPDDIGGSVFSLGSLTSFNYARKRHVKRDSAATGIPRKTVKSEPTASSAPHQAPPGCNSNNNSYPCISQFYGTKGYTPAKDSESVAVLACGGLWTDKSLHSFTANFRPDTGKTYLPQKLTFDDKSAWSNVRSDDEEDVMDIEILVGLAYPLTLSAIATQQEFADMVQSLIDMPDSQRPGVVSISYGIEESDTDAQSSANFCNKVKQLTALGTTFATASGDNGIAVNDASKCPPFQVDMMSACPYVIGVGATTGFNPERAVYERSKSDSNNGWSSGGFSNYYAVPDYQRNATAAYVNSINHAEASYYNASGRGFPDVSAFGEFINLAENGQLDAAGGGTSASSPIVASVLALVNAKCKAKGKPRIGWAHPTFYSNAGAFGDITVGGAYDCASTTLGFPCKAGWDPATGLGSPDFNALVKAFGCA